MIVCHPLYDTMDDPIFEETNTGLFGMTPNVQAGTPKGIVPEMYDRHHFQWISYLSQ
jgi:hypothetical protein